MIGRRHSLWLSSDHLLCVQDGGYTQELARIDLADIESLLVCPTPWFLWTSIAVAVPCLAGLALLLAGTFAWAVLGGCLLVPCLAILAVNLLLGRTCECRLQTKVQTRRLKAVTRYRHAEHVLSAITEAVHRAQADLPAVATAIDALGRQPDENPAKHPPAIAIGEPARQPMHLALFCVFAVQALLLIGLIQAFAMPMLSVCVLGALLLALLAIPTTVLQHRHPCATRLRAATWVSTISVMLGWAGGYLFVLFSLVGRNLAAAKAGTPMENQFTHLVLRVMQDLVAEGLDGGMQAILVVLAVVSGFLALAGIAAFVTAPPRVIPAGPDDDRRGVPAETGLN